MNYKIDSLQNNIESSQDSSNLKKDKIEESSILFDKEKYNSIVADINSLKNKQLEEIANTYKSINQNTIGYDDIYFYVYHYKINNYLQGKYSDKFISLNKKKILNRENKCFVKDVII